MSNKVRPIVPKKYLLIQLRNSQEALTQANERERAANVNLESLESSYVITKDKLKGVTDNNLFLALYAAFRLWRGERRG